ncbi:hypothetical protein L861_12325 [Litchfieldella anticariensis FP35 = DSM 16096]|uniref:Lipoprotein n=1 Tax=Litchfieldella anticariensis (strain DSM 16096 / CECT 5854 / CIP 108499 / LMG 22089 / FP35) TaxID=1121939 RepID=S2KGX6_LITA3|nr:hypothetical protein L861_12325 [Halomonas anticariensis FP35 = DSM 16096]
MQERKVESLSLALVPLAAIQSCGPAIGAHRWLSIQ